MILENKQADFELFWNGRNFVIPEGQFEVEDSLGAFILFKSKKWGKSVVKISTTKEDILKPKIKKIKKEVVVEEVIEEVLDEVKKEEKMKKLKKEENVIKE